LWVLDAETLSGDAREQEAMMIARRIRMLVAEQSLQYKDIAVLLRAFTHVAAYEAAFAQAGIPYYVAGSRGFADKQEIMDVLELLRFLCNPLNEQALFATLRAPFFQLSDDTLLRLRRTGGSDGLWSGLMGAAETGGRDGGRSDCGITGRYSIATLAGEKRFSDSSPIDQRSI